MARKFANRRGLTDRSEEALAEEVGRKDYESLLSEPPSQGDVILIDKFLWGGNVYETCAALVGTG